MPGAGADPVTDEVDALTRHLPRPAGAQVRAHLGQIRPCDDVARWASSGAMALTGDATGPPRAARAPVASRLAAAEAVLAVVSEWAGRRVDVDVVALLGERAALRGLGRAGTTSVGGRTRLLRAADGWVAVALPRPDDWSLVPAWLRAEAPDWESVGDAVARRSVADLRHSGAELGLAVGVVPPMSPEVATASTAPPWRLHPAAPREARQPSDRLRVVDLSALWAGPLCTHLLAEAGAEVVTVEDPTRPDGARRGDPGLHRLLHARASVESVHLSSDVGRRRLSALVRTADIVVTAARPRALRQLGLDPFEQVRSTPTLTWVAITAYGLDGEDSGAIGFGDDAAAAGGLLAGDAEAPMFCADAIADPCTGVLAAIVALGCARTGGAVVDIALRDVAAHLARGPHRVGDVSAHRTGDGWAVTTSSGPVAVAPPRARVATLA